MEEGCWLGVDEGGESGEEKGEEERVGGKMMEHCGMKGGG